MGIKVCTGIKEYELEGVNGVFKIAFNPTDNFFVQKIVDAIETLDAAEAKYEEMIRNEEDPVKVFEAGDAKDKEMRCILDGIFGEGFCHTLFGTISVYAGDGEGFPLWLNILFSVLEEMSTQYEIEKAATNPRLEKYIGKYKK